MNIVCSGPGPETELSLTPKPIFNLLSPTTEICVVCGDVANGFHYGVQTCENCKSCFRRFKTKPPVKKCENGGSCVITPWSRKCVSCKFKKCLEVGMGVKKNSRSRPCTLETLPLYKKPPVHTFSPASTTSSNSALSQIVDFIVTDPEALQEQTRSSILPDPNTIFVSSFLESVKKSVDSCKVCGDIAKHYHSGVRTCRGCSTFFYRYPTRVQTSKCILGGNCVMTIVKRDCAPCRYEKCLEVGMVHRASPEVDNFCGAGFVVKDVGKTDYEQPIHPVGSNPSMPSSSTNLIESLSAYDMGKKWGSCSGFLKMEAAAPVQHPLQDISSPSEPSSANSQVPSHSLRGPEPSESMNDPATIWEAEPPQPTSPSWSHQELRVVVPVFKPQEPPVVAPDLAKTIRNCVQQYGRKAVSSPQEVVNNSQLTTHFSKYEAIEEDEGISTPVAQPVLDQNSQETSIHLPCKVCGAPARFSHCGARACKACAVFFNRQLGKDKSEQCKFTRNCEISAENKSKCTYCRFKKCFTVGMICMNTSSDAYAKAYQEKFKEHMEEEFMSQVDSLEPLRLKRPRKSRSKGPCEVCGDKSRTGKYGVRTCKTCAEFFARQKLSPPVRKCSEPQRCVIASKRKKCRSCRYEKCLELGMTYNEEEAAPSPQPVNAPDPSILLLKELLLFHQRQNSCKICGAKSTGVHHGVLSCDLCEVLFTRVDQNRSCFKCENEGKCILQKGKPICLSCHYNKCLAVGMVAQKGSKSGSERSEKRQSLSESPMGTTNVEISDESSVEPEGPPSQAGSSADQLSLVPNTPPIVFPNQYLDGMANFLQKCEETGKYTVGKMATMVKVEYDWKINETSDTLTNRLSAWQHYSKSLEQDLEVYADLISSLENEVNHLSIDDKFEMFNRNAVKMHILNITRALSQQGLYLSDGRFIEYPVLELLYGAELLNDMIELSRKILEAEFLDEDIALLILLGFYQGFEEPENQLDDEKHVEELHEQYKSHIKFVCQRDEVALEKYEEMVELVPRIYQIYLKHHDLAGFLNQHSECFEHGTYFRGAYMKTKYQYEQVSDEMK
ncbi:unnamed protein product [Caenorhabditis brenneri]